MLTLKAPIRLNIQNSILSSPDSLSQRIRANYELSAAEIYPKELLFLLTNPPELPETGGMTTFAVETSVQNRQQLLLNVVNNVVNRVMIAERENFTYQDSVYITNVLNKLGITDVAQFMRQVRELREETLDTRELTRLYSENRERIEGLERELGSAGGRGRPGEPGERGEDTESLRYFLQTEIYRRLDTRAIYDRVREFARSSAEEYYTLSPGELTIAEQTRLSNSLALYEAKTQALHSENVTLRRYTNLYETGALLPPPTTETQVLEQGAAAALLTTVDGVLTARLETVTARPEFWLNVTNALSRTAESSIARFEAYHTERSDVSYVDESYLSRSSALMRSETAVLRSLSEYISAYGGVSVTNAEGDSFTGGATMEHLTVNEAPEGEGHTPGGTVSREVTTRELSDITSRILGGDAPSVRERARVEARERETILRRERERRETQRTERREYFETIVGLTRLQTLFSRDIETVRERERATEELQSVLSSRRIEGGERLSIVRSLTPELTRELILRRESEIERERTTERTSEELRRETAERTERVITDTVRQATERRSETERQSTLTRESVETLRLEHPASPEPEEAQPETAEPSREPGAVTEREVFRELRELQAQASEEKRLEPARPGEPPQAAPEAVQPPEARDGGRTERRSARVEAAAPPEPGRELIWERESETERQRTTERRSEELRRETEERTERIITDTVRQATERRTETERLSALTRESAETLRLEHPASPEPEAARPETAEAPQEPGVPPTREIFKELRELQTRVVEPRPEVTPRPAGTAATPEAAGAREPRSEEPVELRLDRRESATEPSEKETERITESRTESQRDLELLRRLDVINRRNRERYQKVQERQLETIRRETQTPDRGRTLRDALRAMDAPAEVLQEAMRERAETAHPEAALPPAMQAILAQADPATRQIYETVLRYEQNPAAALREGTLKPANAAAFNAETLRVEREAAAELVHRAEPQIEEELRTVRETTESVIERLREPQTRTVEREREPRPAVSIVHKRTETEIPEELLERMERQERRTEEKKTVTTEVNAQETVTQTQVNELIKTGMAKTSEDMTELINRTLQRQLGAISDKVYSQMEKRLQLERARRGRF